jgi:hypothetical protein
MKLRDGINLFNRVMNTNFGRSCVVALWREEDLITFSSEELEELAQHAREDNSNRGRRLLIRIGYAKAAKEKAST